jgi:hypothetical protein
VNLITSVLIGLLAWGLLSLLCGTIVASMIDLMRGEDDLTTAEGVEDVTRAGRARRSSRHVDL